MSNNIHELLFESSKNGEVAEVLNHLKEGADPNKKCSEGQTAIEVAIEKGHEEVVRAVLDHGTNIILQNETGTKALMYACHFGHVPVVRLLIEYFTNSNINVIEINQEIIDAERLNVLDARDYYGCTALIYACRKGHTSVVNELIVSGATVDAEDIYGYTTLMYASIYGHDTTVKLLIDSGATVDAPDEDGRTPLIAASSHGQVEVIRLLIAANADPNATTICELTALMSVLDMIENETELCLSIIQQLLNAGADATMKDSEGKTFIDHAPEEYRKQLQELVVQYELSNGYQSGQLK